MTPEQALSAAITQSWLAKGTTSPNPPVGAVIISPSGELLGQGHTAPPGGPHAEIQALHNAGDKARGALCVVTLEPCAHTGRTGPCAAALIEAGIKEVHYAVADPIHGGADMLRNAGVEVTYLNIPVAPLSPWLRATAMGRPHVTAKFAQTLDGFTAAIDGTSQWITGSSARSKVHLDRSRRDAIIIGTGTALADDPQLTARGNPDYHQPRRVIVGKRTVPKTSNLARLGYEQYPDLVTALDALYASGAMDVLIEGGPTLALSALQLGVVDAVQSYIAPKLLGAGQGVLNAVLANTITQALTLTPEGIEWLGEDVLIEYSVRHK